MEKIDFIESNWNLWLVYWNQTSSYTDTNDAERSERPNYTEKQKTVLNNREVRLLEIADFIRISIDCLHYILHEYLGIRMLYSKLLTDVLKQADHSEPFFGAV